MRSCLARELMMWKWMGTLMVGRVPLVLMLVVELLPLERERSLSEDSMVERLEMRRG